MAKGFGSRFRIKRKLARGEKQLSRLNKSLIGADRVVVGLPKNSNPYPDGTSVIMVGVVHEFGRPDLGIPQRSFLRATIEKNRRQYKTLFRKLGEKIVDEKIDIEEALQIMGIQVAGDVVQTISKGPPPPLAKVRSGKGRGGISSSNPLNDTGHLKQSITFEVR